MRPWLAEPQVSKRGGGEERVKRGDEGRKYLRGVFALKLELALFYKDTGLLLFFFHAAIGSLGVTPSLNVFAKKNCFQGAFLIGNDSVTLVR